MNNQRVLLTGVSGFLGSHTTLKLLDEGYEVVGTVLNKSEINDMRDIIGRHSSKSGNLSLVQANLNDEEIWYNLSEGVDYIQHIASPVLKDLPRNENELIIPEKEGTLNILRAATENGVKRVIMVSALAAIVYGKQKHELDKEFNENHWTDETNKKDTTLSARSKTIAEKTAWDFIEQNNSGLELTTVLPGTILGPILEKYHGRSAHLITKLLGGSSGSLPKVGFEVVDVRSVADLLIKAMEVPQAANERYIASSEYLTYKEIALLLQEQYPDRNMSISELPRFAAKLVSYFEPALEHVLIEWGKNREIDRTKANKELQWQPLPANETVVACAESILENEIIK